jgi:hypothetical protein
MTLAWAYTDAMVTQDPVYAGKQLYNVPKHSGSINLAYQLGQDSFGNNWRIGGGTRFVGERQGDAANSFQLPSYFVTDAFIAWQTRLHGQKLEIQANLKNVFDKPITPPAPARPPPAIAAACPRCGWAIRANCWSRPASASDYAPAWPVHSALRPSNNSRSALSWKTK